MLHLYVTIRDENLEVVMLDRNVIGARSNLRSNRECDRPSIIFVNNEYLFKNTAQHLRSVSLKFKYELNLLHNTYER